MEFYEVLRARRSIRSFRNEAIPDEIFRRLAQSVVCAPSACNRQPYRFLWIRSKDVLEKLRAVTRQPDILAAPAVVACLVNRSAAWRRDEKDDRSIGEIDLAIAVEHLVLAITAEKLGCCWVAAFDTERAAEILGIREPYRVDILLPVGYPAADASAFVRNVSPEEMMKVL